MPKTNEIIDAFNTKLQTGVFNDKRFQKGQFYGVAELLPRDQRSFPAIVANDGSCTEIIADDRYPFQSYHRILSIGYEKTEETKGGERYVRETVAVVYIMIADRNQMQITAQELASGAHAGIPEFTKAERANWSLYDIEIRPGVIQFDKEQIYRQEYGNTGFNLRPNYIMLGMPYTIETVYIPSCFNLC